MPIIRIVTEYFSAEFDLAGVEWIFGYGSLMWRPGFPYLEQCRAHLKGYRRTPCVYSYRHRGTSEVPGLVLGLDKGSGCDGIAYRIDIKKQSEIFDYLNEREMIGYPYRPTVRSVRIGLQEVSAYTFVVDTAHDGYAGELDEEAAAELILRAAGISGLNRDYLINTVEKLMQLGVAEPELTRLYNRVRELSGEIDAGSGI